MNYQANYARPVSIRNRREISRSIQNLNDIYPLRQTNPIPTRLQRATSLPEIQRVAQNTAIAKESGISRLRQGISNLKTKILDSGRRISQNKTFRKTTAPFVLPLSLLLKGVKYAARSPTIQFLTNILLFAGMVGSAFIPSGGQHDNHVTVPQLDSALQQSEQRIYDVQENSTHQLLNTFDQIMYYYTQDNLASLMPPPLNLNDSLETTVSSTQSEIAIDQAIRDTLAFYISKVQEKFNSSFSSEELFHDSDQIIKNFGLAELLSEKSQTLDEAVAPEFQTFLSITTDKIKKQLHDPEFIKHYPSVRGSKEYRDIYDTIQQNDGSLLDIFNLDQATLADQTHTQDDVLIEDLIQNPGRYLTPEQRKNITEIEPEKPTQSFWNPLQRFRTAYCEDPLICVQNRIANVFGEKLTKNDLVYLFQN